MGIRRARTWRKAHEQADVQHAQALQASWLAFVRTGQPGADAKGQPWPRLRLAQPSLMGWGPSGAQVQPVPDLGWLQALAQHPQVHAN